MTDAVLPLAKIHPMWAALAVLAPIVLLLVRRRRPLPRWALPATVVAVVVGAVLGSGVVELPTLEDLPLQEIVEDIGDAVGAWAYLIVGVLAFLETGAFVGLLAPGETFVILAGVLAGEGTLGYVELLTVVWICAFSGDMASFFLGRKLGRSFLEQHGPRFKITADRLSQVEGFFDKHGGKAVVIGRFLGFVRAVAPFVLGSSGVAARRFVPYSVIGSGLWSALFVTLGYVFWQSLDQLLKWAKQGAFVFGTIVTVVVAAFVIAHWLQEPENRERARQWLHDAGQTRAGRMARAAWRPFDGPARFVWARITPGDLGLEVTTLLAIVAVGAFAFFGLHDVLEGRPTTRGDDQLLRWLDDVRIGVAEDIARVGLVLGEPWVVGGLTLLAALFLAWKRRLWVAVTLMLAVGLGLLVTALVRDGEHRAQPPGALEVLDGSSFPSAVAAGAVGWVAVAVALAPVLRRVPGRIGLTGLAAILAVAISCAPLVLRAAYLSDVFAGAGLAAAVMALVGLVGLFVAHLRQNPVR
ncbi:DedA family protein [Patulibacter defluvii]|uniref:DedA family protein n=1 Tax=Patulibacter defluvii TaxID=3095358 RepID=UPI002A757726|nr:DedA family protein [Patulibacter sp. DM4]